jgi:DNA polymerase I
MKHYFIKPNNVSRMVESLRTRSSFGFDTETTDLDPFKGELRLMQFSPDPDKAFLIDKRDFENSPDALAPVCDLLSDPAVEKIGHNLKFDAKFVKHHLGCDLEGVWDTMLGSQIEGCGEPGIRHGLGFATERILGIEVDKSEQRSDWGANELSERQVEYAARDVGVLHELQNKLLKRLMSKHLMGVVQLENDIVMAMAQIELNGFFLDASMWRQQLRHVEKQIKKEANTLQDMLSAGVRQMGLFGRLEIDLGSSQQVADALLGLGVPVPQTDLGNYTTQETNIEPLKYKYPVVEQLLEWRGLYTQLTSYGENILDLISLLTGRLHADFRQIKAPSGRMGCSNPNLQQVPGAPEYRRCFRAPEGKKLIIADFSQIELRVMAEFSQDPAMIRAFHSGGDYHSATAMEVYKLSDPSQVSAEQRTFAKRLNFGIGYGMGPGRFARMNGCSYEDAEAFIKAYFDALRGLDKWLKKQAYSSVRKRQAETLSGRKAKLTFDERDNASRSGAERQGKNIPIQGTAADIFKRALYLQHTALKGTSGKIVNLVHDEFDIEADASDADVVAAKVEECMARAGREYITSVPITAEVKIQDEWSKE